MADLLAIAREDYAAGKIEADELEREIEQILAGKVPERLHDLVSPFEMPKMDRIKR